MQRAKVSVRPA